MKEKSTLSRRRFLGTAAAAAGAFAVVPTIVPSRVFGAQAPSNRVNGGVIGCGRKGLGDLKHAADLKDRARIVAVCDVDAKRLRKAKDLVDKFYGDGGCASYGDFREMLSNGALDAVIISTPDHWHALPAVAAARAGKAVFVQKPLSLTIAEGRAIADAAAEHKTVFQVGSQCRSDPKYRYCCQVVREGLIGDLEHVDIGLPTDPAGEEEPVRPGPDNLDYDFWLGQAPDAPYTEKRVHPQQDYGRPGWLRIRDYGAGMITGWGTHEIDIAHWGMGAEHTGPVSVEGWARFPESGLWNVHTDFDLTYRYANGVTMRVAAMDHVPQGVKFIGSEGWVFISRGTMQAEPASLLTREGAPENRTITDADDARHMQEFIDSIRTGAPTTAPAETGHRSCTACLLGAIVMQLGRKVAWDPESERIPDDPEAQAMTARPMREPWTI